MTLSGLSDSGPASASVNSSPEGGISLSWKSPLGAHRSQAAFCRGRCEGVQSVTFNKRSSIQTVHIVSRGPKSPETEERIVEEAIKEDEEPPPADYEPLVSAPSPASSLDGAASSLDRIEQQARASIDKLKHILYKLKSRPSDVKTTITAAQARADAPSFSANIQTPAPSLVETEREVFIAQKFEVKLGGNGVAAPSAAKQVVDVEQAVQETKKMAEGSSSAALARAAPGGAADQALDGVEYAAQQQVFDEAMLDAQSAAQMQYDALTCTHTTVHIDDDNQTAIVTVTATVRGADLRDEGLCSEMVVAMAARALARTCLALDERAQQAALGSAVAVGAAAQLLPAGGGVRRHDKVLRRLERGQVKRAQEVAVGAYGSTPFRQAFDVTLVQEDGSEVAAIFKPIVPGDRFGRWKRASADLVAYKVAQLLDLDVVPPAVIRIGVYAGGVTHTLGVLMHKVADERPLQSLKPQEWGTPATAAATVAGVHILDALLGSAARGPEGFRAGRHWENPGHFRPVIMENPMMGPRGGQLHSMWSQRGQAWDGLKVAPPATLARLQGLSRSALLEALGGALTADEMEEILEKKNQVLAYFDALASRQSRHLVTA